MSNKEVYKAFEEVTTRNIKSVIVYSKDTRELVRKLEEQVLDLKAMVTQRDSDIILLRQQLAKVQAVLFRGGTSGN